MIIKIGKSLVLAMILLVAPAIILPSQAAAVPVVVANCFAGCTDESGKVGNLACDGGNAIPCHENDNMPGGPWCGCVESPFEMAAFCMDYCRDAY